ncbi:hypothetical protein D3C80_1932120 [compost metagenome]
MGLIHPSNGDLITLQLGLSRSQVLQSYVQLGRQGIHTLVVLFNCHQLFAPP